jgi:hypothetical protein
VTKWLQDPPTRGSDGPGSCAKETEALSDIIGAEFAGIAAAHALQIADAAVAPIDLRDHRIVPSAVK